MVYGTKYIIIMKYLFNRMGFNDNESWYNKTKLMNFYNNYIHTVLHDFKNDKLFLCFDVNNPNKQKIIHMFLGTQINKNVTFPHLLKNK